ncbi:EamA family transporter [Pseudooceanicola sp. 216_PA32_1]|uniref:EamA family transporter n=1 Tax=Pseudooceanicola pacificus TaxID=2676438 RepID=A0A844WGB3_9RHOB|nr:DMT family transporter [Pseudooceanicola pacificus]MWB79860.1 EamA family transporter [Pseudooceanicola pacificus]
MTDNMRGAFLMMGSMALFTLNYAVVKSLAAELPVTQIVVLRGLVTSLAAGLLAWRMGAFGARLGRRNRRLILLRTAAEIVSAYFFLQALVNLPLANVSAVMQSAPLSVTLAAALFLAEPVGWKRLSAILAGFVGVLLILRPGGEGFNIFALYSLAAVAFVTLRDLTTRRLSRDVPSMVVTLATAVGVTLAFSAASLATDWGPVGTGQGVLIGLAALLLTAAYLCSISAMRVGDVSFVAPFRYTSMLWALVLGFAVFGQWPDWITLAGAALVVGSGLFTLYRERQLGRAPRVPVPPR